MMLQNIIAGLIVLAAGLYMVYRLRANASGKGCGCGCSGCPEAQKGCSNEIKLTTSGKRDE